MIVKYKHESNIVSSFKKGDLGSIKNWSFVLLLCTGYKILSKSLFHRLQQCMEISVHPRWNHCVPGYTVMDNLFLMCDVQVEIT